MNRTVTFKYASPKFKLLFKRKRYKLLYGGRGGAKSHSIARALLEIGNRRSVRIVCGRETQNSIKESIKYLFDLIIKENDLSDLYESTNDYIRHRLTGTLITFIGLQDHNSQQVKGLESVDIFWGDEANQFSEKTLRFLIPTIRKARSEIWMSWNPELPTDAIDQKFIMGKKKENAFYIEVGFEDNRFLSDEAKQESEDLKEEDHKEWLHVWGGHYRMSSDDAVIDLELVVRAQKIKPARLNVPIVAGLDLARYGDDPTGFYIRQGFETLYHKEWLKQGPKMTAGKVEDLRIKFGFKYLWFDANGLGDGAADWLHDTIGCETFEYSGSLAPDDSNYYNKRTESWYLMKEWLEEGGSIPDDKNLTNELILQRYKYKTSNQKILVDKETMRKKGIKSPNIADALSFTFEKPEPNTKDIKRKMYG